MNPNLSDSQFGPYFHGTSLEAADDIEKSGARAGLNLAKPGARDIADDYARVSHKWRGGGVVLEGYVTGNDHHEEPWGLVTSRPGAFKVTKRHPYEEPK